jgi:hypothetical protein
MSFARPTVELSFDPKHGRRRLSILAVRASPGEPEDDECLYTVLGCDASPVWVRISSLKPFIQEGRILS